MDYLNAGGLRIARRLYEFINNEAAPGTGVATAQFWRGLDTLIRDLAPHNKSLLDKRDALQSQIDAWHLRHRGKRISPEAYVQFLRDIGYLHPEPSDFSIGIENVDAEIATIAGPQLVVPVTNARYALNAANARWGSLYDALYGTDALPEDGGATRGSTYNPARGERVIAKSRQILDRAVPLAIGSHRDAIGYRIDDGRLAVTLKDNARTGLTYPEQFLGYRGDVADPSSVLLKHHGLHIEIVINRSQPIGQQDAAGIADVLLEAAVTTIQD